MALRLCVLFLPLVLALPSLRVPESVREDLRLRHLAGLATNEEDMKLPCLSRYCHKPDASFQRILPVSPRIQWDIDGGYCGSMSIQDIALGTGVWLSQQQVRDHAQPGGGHDSEILATNVDAALKALKLEAEGFDYKNLPTPQADAYRAWIKKQLVAGNGVIWMIMLEGGHYPVYPGLPYGYYSHVEPVYGILSNHPLTDDTFYDDDYLAHGTDVTVQTYYRRFDSLVAGVDSHNRSECGGGYLGFPCIFKDYGFGWAIKGPADGRTDALPLSLSVDRSDEPDTRVGRKAVNMKATVTATMLTSGNKYQLWRFNSTDTAFDYTGSPYHEFTAAASSYTFLDHNPILSSSATYYRCLPSK